MNYAWTVCRWSLIAGRLPGRTANDVKNFWNTNLQKKLTNASDQNDMVKNKELIQRKQDNTSIDATSTSIVIKPLPRTLSKGTRLACYNLNSSYHIISPLPGKIIHNNIISNNNSNSLVDMQPTTPPFVDQDGVEFWKNLLTEMEIRG